MPSNVIKSFAKKTSKPVSAVEKVWNDTVDEQLKKMDQNDDKFYPTVVTIVKKKLNIKDGDKEAVDNMDKKVNTVTKQPVAGVRSATDKPIKENFSVGLADANMNYDSGPVTGNGAYYGKMGNKKRKAKKKNKKTFKESGSFLLSTSSGSLNNKQQKKEKLTEIDEWTKKWGRSPL